MSTRPAELKNLSGGLQRIADLLASLEFAIRDCRRIVDKSDSIEDATAAVSTLLKSVPDVNNRLYPLEPFEMWLIPGDEAEQPIRSRRFTSADEANRNAKLWNRDYRPGTNATAVVRVAEGGGL